MTSDELPGLPDFRNIAQNLSNSDFTVRSKNHLQLTVFNPEMGEETLKALEALTPSQLNLGQEEIGGKKWSLFSAIAKPHTMLFTVIFPATSGSWSLAAGIPPAATVGFSYFMAILLIYADKKHHDRNQTKAIELAKLAGSQYIRAQWLSDSYADLLCSSAKTVNEIRESDIVKKDLIDATKVEVRLPRILWDIAHTMHEITVLREEAKAAGANSKSPQMRALDIAMQPVRKRMAALETCAQQVKDADAKYREFQRQKQLSGMDDRISDLLIRAQVDDPALEEIRDLSIQAAAAHAVFQEALDKTLASIDEVLAVEG